jgi:hypothetical protein
MGELYFQKISKYDRPCEPVTVSIPFARGKLTRVQDLHVWDGGRHLPVQARALAGWPDGSIKWLLVHLQPDLPGNGDKTLRFDVARSSGAVPAPDQAVTVADQPDGLEVQTGPLAFRIPRQGFLPVTDVRWQNQRLWTAQSFGGFTLRCGDKSLTSAGGPVELEVEEAGPLRAVILVRGKHRRPDGQGYVDLRGRVTAYAGKSYIEVEHQFVHAEADAVLSLESLRLDVAPDVAGEPSVALGEGYYQTRIQRSEQPLDMTINTETLLYQSNEHYSDCFYGDFWIDWRDDQAGLSLSIHQAHQNFPKALRVEPDRLICALWPASEKPAEIRQGMAKTHRVMLHFHGPDTPLDEISARSLQFQLPDRPSLSPAWYRENNPWDMPFFPAKVPDRLYTWLSQVHDARPLAYGMLHFGDAPDDAYSHQGRGRGETVWVNNEYDRTHACTLYSALTRLRHVQDSGLVAARHWLDVDICHHSSDPLRRGGIVLHSAHHVSERVTPSHEWVEGLLDYYYLTGREEALEAAHEVAENIMRHMAQPQMSTPGDAQTREGGWALRAMVAMALATGQDRYRSEARRLVELFMSWDQLFGGMLAPYTSHTMPRVVFMISLTVNSIARYLLLDDDERIKRLIVAAADDLIAHCLGPGGIFWYKELPSLRRSLPSPHVLEMLTHAYNLTGNRRYLEVASRQFFETIAMSEAVPAVGKKYVTQGGVVESGSASGRNFEDRYASIILFAGAATPLGLLDWFEYPI